MNRSTQKTDLTSYTFGKIPPQAIDIEEAVLGAILLESSAMSLIVGVIKANMFYKTAHELIYKAVNGLYQGGHPIDILTVTEELKRMGDLETVGGPHYIMELTNRVASAGNIEYHAYIITQKYLQREVIRVSSSMLKEAYEDTTDVFELITKMQKSTEQITVANLHTGEKNATQLFRELREHMENARKIKQERTDNGFYGGIPSNLLRLDEITDGWQDSDLIIVAARPGMGKTSFTKKAIKGSLSIGKPVAMFSTEMASVQLTARLVSEDLKLPIKKILKGELDEVTEKKVFERQKFYDDKLFIDDGPLNITELKIKCRRLKMNHNIGLIVLDYLQLMEAAKQSKYTNNREQDVSEMSRGCKLIAKELNVPFIALSQLSRSVESRGGNMQPRLSDLRESGSIEQDADIVIFIYRPEYYHQQKHKKFDMVKLVDNGPDVSSKGIAQLIIAKHRNGDLGSEWFRFDGKYTQFENLNYDIDGNITDEAVQQEGLVAEDDLPF